MHMRAESILLIRTDRCRQQIQIQGLQIQRHSFVEYLQHVKNEQSNAIKDFVTGVHHEEDLAQLQFMEEHDEYHASLMYDNLQLRLRPSQIALFKCCNDLLFQTSLQLSIITKRMLKGGSCVSQMLNTLNVISGLCATIGMSLVQIFKWKMRLNAIKYPAGVTTESVESSRSIPKYTELAHITNYKGDDANHVSLPAIYDKPLTQAYIRQELVEKEKHLHSMLYSFAEQRG